jgi:SpoVK/Ycf46/Vps4 family AAA+-type ATPase
VLGSRADINQLKEMVALPLLYPEVFQQFGITPPRGVLFHGPPGTGELGRRSKGAEWPEQEVEEEEELMSRQDALGPGFGGFV